MRVFSIFFVRAVLLIILCVTSVPHAVHADTGLTVTPAVVDKKASARDILKETISLTNSTDHSLFLYPSVVNVDSIDGEQAFSVPTDSSQRATSLANWIELSRGVIEVAPGETKNVPYVIRVNLNAVPGVYHAQISFGNGSTRDEAEAQPLATIMVNVEIKADTKEILQLNKFYTDNIFFSGDDVLFNYQIQNIGNQELQPTGEIRIYDRKGQEVASVDVNRDGKVVTPDQISQLASVWNGAKGFGKYKALLTVDYGKGQVATVQDTVFFWIVPWQQILALFVGSLITIVFFVLYFHRMFEQRHAGRIALAEISHHLPHAHEALHAPVVSIPNAQSDAPVLASPSRIGRVMSAVASSAAGIGHRVTSVPSSIAGFVSRRAHTKAVNRAAVAETMAQNEVAVPVVPQAPLPPVGAPVPPVAVPIVETPQQPVYAPPSPAPAPVAAASVPGATINLKSIRSSTSQAEYTASHVISLKKRA